jgi:brefeldin A-inhibited guanine nucleotide-exchange protein
MFEVAWMAFLAGLSGPLQDTDDLEIVELCLDGFKSSIHIVCFFDLDLQRTSFVTTLAKFTFLNNLGEMKTKNMEAIKSLLDVAVNEGNNLKGCWRDILTCVSQLERMQLIGSKSDPAESKRRQANSHL